MKHNDWYRRRKVIRTRIYMACYTMAFIGFIYMAGIVGGLEQDLMTIKEFIMRSMIALPIMIILVSIGNRFERLAK